jgi:hypothetical protein
LASLPIDPFATPAGTPSMDDGYDTALPDALPPLRPDPFAPHDGHTETYEATVAASYEEPIALEHPDQSDDDALSPIIPERDAWEIPAETPADPIVPTSDESTVPAELFVPIAWRAPALVPAAAAPLASDDATVVTAGAGHTIGVQVGDDFLTVHVDGEVVVKVDRQLAPEG